MSRIAVVTGGTRVIGAAIATALKGAGYKVVASYAGNDEAATKFKAETGIEVMKWDVGSYDACETAIKKIENDFGPVDILINNAGIARSGTLLKLTEEAWDEVLDVNLKGIFRTTKAVARHMIEAKYGKIVNVSSIYGRTGVVGDSNYAASKAGIVGFTKSTARELARHNINVNAILPGMVDTPLLRGIPDRYLKTMIEEIPLRRVGTPGDIANVAAFLVSDAASYITGAAIEVTGGWRM